MDAAAALAEATSRAHSLVNETAAEGFFLVGAHCRQPAEMRGGTLGMTAEGTLGVTAEDQVMRAAGSWVR